MSAKPQQAEVPRSKVPSEQPFQFRRVKKQTKGRWNGSDFRRYGDGRSAYPRDRDGKADRLISLLYNGPRSTELAFKHSWFERGEHCFYHQGALISGMPLSERQRLQRRKDLASIRGDLDQMRGF